MAAIIAGVVIVWLSFRNDFFYFLFFSSFSFISFDFRSRLFNLFLLPSIFSSGTLDLIVMISHTFSPLPRFDARFTNIVCFTLTGPVGIDFHCSPSFIFNSFPCAGGYCSTLPGRL